MLGYRLSSAAQADLIAIRRYTDEHWGRPQSVQYLAGIRETLLLLAKSPNLGKPRKDVGPDVYSFSHASHVIYYRLQADTLTVFAVLHKRMVPDLHLGDRSRE